MQEEELDPAWWNIGNPFVFDGRLANLKQKATLKTSVYTGPLVLKDLKKVLKPILQPCMPLLGGLTFFGFLLRGFYYNKLGEMDIERIPFSLRGFAIILFSCWFYLFYMLANDYGSVTRKLSSAIVTRQRINTKRKRRTQVSAARLAAETKGLKDHYQNEQVGVLQWIDTWSVYRLIVLGFVDHFMHGISRSKNGATHRIQTTESRSLFEEMHTTFSTMRRFTLLVVLLFSQMVMFFRHISQPANGPLEISKFRNTTSRFISFCHIHLLLIMLILTLLLISRNVIKISPMYMLKLITMAAFTNLFIHYSLVDRLPITYTPYMINSQSFGLLDLLDSFSSSAMKKTGLLATLPTVLEFGQLVANCLMAAIIAAVLYHYKVMQKAFMCCGYVLQLIFDLTAVEAFALLLPFFISPTSMLVLLSVYFSKLNESELFLALVSTLTHTTDRNDRYWSIPDCKLIAHLSYVHFIRTVIAVPLIVLTCKLMYPATDKSITNPKVFHMLDALNCKKPFGTLMESVFFLVSHLFRCLRRYLSMLIVSNCLFYLVELAFHMSSCDSSLFDNYKQMITRLTTTVVAQITELPIMYKHGVCSLSYHIAMRFVDPNLTFMEFFGNGCYSTNSKNFTDIDPAFRLLRLMDAPFVQMVSCGNFHWQTIILFLSFAIDCLPSNHTDLSQFLVRAAVSAVFVYACMYLLLILGVGGSLQLQAHESNMKFFIYLKEECRNMKKKAFTANQ